VSGSQGWHILYADSVVREDIPRLGQAERQRIRQAIETKLARDPIHFGKPLRYSLSGQRSLRVGDYRVLFLADAQERSVSVTAIGHRRDIYEG
jgi:mRNA interferase RelE/StbE